MPILWSARPADWQRSRPSLDWLGEASPSSAPRYPVVFDALEAALRQKPSPLLRATALAIAPRWDELVHSCAVAEPQRHDAPENIDQSESRLVVHAAARAIAELGSGYGLALVLPSPADGLLHTFVTQLARFADQTGFTVACVATPVVLARNSFLVKHAASVDAAPPPRPTVLPDGLDPQSKRALSCLAASRIGAPVDAVVALGLREDTASSFAATGPDGEPWLRLSARARRRLWGRLDAADRRSRAAALFDAWAPDGWGYLRRAHLAQLGRDASRMLRQHGALVAGYRIVGRTFLQQHCAALALASSSSNGDVMARERGIAAHISAARLAPHLTPAKAARSAAVFHFGCARRLAIAPREKSQLTADLANAYAVQRHPRCLAHARHLYEQGLNDLEDVHDDVERLRVHISMLNGLALVDYHEGKNLAALALERRAEQLAGQLASLAPTLGRWAYALLGVNTAKLLAGRFDDRAGARKELEVALGLTAADHHAELIRRALGQFYFDEREFGRVIDVLTPIYPPESSAIEAADDEFHDRLLLAVAQLTENYPDLCAAQMPRLHTLAHRMGTDAWVTAVDLVRGEMSRKWAVTAGASTQQETRQGV